MRPSTCAWTILAACIAASPLSAQFTDIQPGRNYPTALHEFGAGRSENIDVGDVDRDGDYDVGVANGGDGGPQPNVIYINQGGWQGGTEGTFVDETAMRFVGVPNDTSRDIEFVDYDGDADLDVFIANRGTTVNGGEVSRAYANRGGRQLGTLGVFTEDTDNVWGTLVGVPLAQEDGVQDGFGPWRDFSCDCDFGDFDDDGDLDLFHSTYGPNVNGAYESRVFLNDGVGRFDELYPWADASADIKLHTFDIDLADFDGDFDLDVFASSRNSQARLYLNNHSDDGWAGDPFTDVTQTHLIDTGATLVGNSNYEAEFGDLDGDGDFDLYVTDFTNFKNDALRNNGGMFSKTDWIKGDPQVDDNEVDFFDFDSDGDLDAFLAVFSGTNRIFQSGLAQGVPMADGLLHRTGTTSAGGLVEWNETPASGNGGTSLDADCADMDGDGDPDIVLANDSNRQNRYWENVLGVPDTHAPTFRAVTVQGDKADGSDTVIRAAVLDNEAYYIIAFHDAQLIYTVDGGPETCVAMASSSGQQFRGVIPGALDGTIAYRVEVTDGAGNTGVSATTTYEQTASGSPLWQNLGCGTEGQYGVPYLQLAGTQLPASPVTLSLRDAAPNALFLLWLSFSSTPIQALGGTVYAQPFHVQVLASTDLGGMLHATANWPGGLPSGTDAWWQAIIADPTSFHGLVLSNAVQGTTP